jgi:hypothetical protein
MKKYIWSPERLPAKAARTTQERLRYPCQAANPAMTRIVSPSRIVPKNSAR